MIPPTARLCFALAIFCPAFASADVKLPAVISDHMVLQQETKANVWGWAAAGEEVTAEFAGQKLRTKADEQGNWQVRFENLAAGTAGDLTVAGKNKLTVRDVLVGEVWLCSGQSNMEWTVKRSARAAEEIAAANFPKIRMFTAKRNAQFEPQVDLTGSWQVCSPQTAGEFSAVGYFFGRKLHQTLQQPIGLIHTSWGGTEAELWTPKPVLAANPEFKEVFTRWEKKVADYPQAKARYDVDAAEWPAKKAAAEAAGHPVPKAPRAPDGNTAFRSPACLFNGMIAPLVPYTIQGAIWYQGEGNAVRPIEYRKLFPTMIYSWRRAWMEGGLAGSDSPDFPFLFVQLANYQPRHAQPTESNWAKLREAQLMTLDLPRTAMAVTIDIGEADDIHPANKQDVGHRLALAAEATVYYRDQEFSGPIYGGVQFEEGKARLSFLHAEGLKSKDGGPLQGFALAGQDQKFHWAEAEIQGDHIIVTSKDVPEPASVRYAWADNPACNLVNSAGLPASPFRSDEWGDQ